MSEQQAERPGHAEAHEHHRYEARPARNSRTPLPLAWFGVPLGVTGLAGGWSAAQTDLGAPQWPAESLYGIATLLWAACTVGYLITATRARTFASDRRNPITGPFSAYIPLIAILLAAHYSSDATTTDMTTAATTLKWITAAAVAALAVVAAQLVAHWLTSGIRLQDIHPGYFVPVVAGANVASIGLSQIGQHQAAIGAFAAGLFFWLVIGTAVIVRLIAHGPLPTPLKPALSAFLAASATSSLAWIISHPGPIDEVQMGLTGILVLMLLVQLALLPEYARLTPGFSFWIFTFPVASTTNYAVRFLSATTFVGGHAWAWAILSAASAFFVFVTVASLPRKARAKDPRPSPPEEPRLRSGS